MPYYPPDRIGGVGEFAATLHRALLARGVDSTVVTRGRGPDEPGVMRIARGRLAWFFGTLGQTRRAANADIVHVQSGEALPVLLALRAWPGRRARVITTYHVDNRRMAQAEEPYALGGERFGEATTASGRLRSALHRFVDRAGLSLADGITCVAEATARDLLGPQHGARVIHNGVAPSEGDTETAAPVALFYAGLAGHRKRVLALPFVLARVRERHPDTRLRVAGFARGDWPPFDALCARLGVGEAVDFAGALPSDALPAHYRAAGVALVPSAYEGLPYAILEAMREGTPVVATRTGGHAEIVRDGEDGFLVDVDDVEAMAARCVALLDDAALAERMGAAARRRVAAGFDRDAQIDAYLDYYRSLAEGTP